MHKCSHAFCRYHHSVYCMWQLEHALHRTSWCPSRLYAHCDQAASHFRSAALAHLVNPVHAMRLSQLVHLSASNAGDQLLRPKHLGLSTSLLHMRGDPTFNPADHAPLAAPWQCPMSVTLAKPWLTCLPCQIQNADHQPSCPHVVALGIFQLCMQGARPYLVLLVLLKLVHGRKGSATRYHLCMKRDLLRSAQTVTSEQHSW
jgi:hypothetical protein